MTKKIPTPRRTPEGALVSATDAADLLGIGRTRFWQLRKEFELQRVPWSPETRPLYRREDVLKLVAGPQGGQAVPAVPPAEPVAQTATAPRIDPKKVRAVDAGFKVMPGFEDITVEEWHEANRDALRRKQSAHLPDLE
ncbi:hypothetical protein [Rhizobium leguminosarum]|uniref:hypothetical protein n=1 Tax=Rhizobium leguminosarum TaxID=384 RepID=UPI00140F7117|nr:hypothetical protein [Rhizobium leguminosarum]QIO64728.1 hypothetical protein HA462_06580 [Rhizobium leguminosarum bv. trifolii]